MAHTDGDIDRAIEAAGTAFQSLKLNASSPGGRRIRESVGAAPRGCPGSNNLVGMVASEARSVRPRGSNPLHQLHCFHGVREVTGRLLTGLDAVDEMPALVPEAKPVVRL